MPRTDNDTWDLASSVGATATMVAAQRALANRDGLIDDPFAEPLVRAVGMDFFTPALDGEVDLAEVDPEFNLRHAAESMAVRTRWFDKLLPDAAAQSHLVKSLGIDSVHARTGCRGPTGRPCTSSTSRKSSSSRPSR
jgi:O-methyltransferase involved in polyketide biosynthesis